MGSYPAAGVTAMDAVMPLSPPTDNVDDKDEGEGRCYATRREGGGGDDKGTRAVGGRRKERVDSGAFPYLICVCESQSQICDL